MKLLAIAVLLAVVIALAWAVYTLFARAARGYRQDHGEWCVKQRTLPGRRVGIFLLPPGGGEPQLFGEPISQRLPEYEFQEALTERRVGAQERVDTLNRRLNP